MLRIQSFQLAEVRGQLDLIPGNAILPFSYGSEHISDDIAVAVIERVIQCIERVKADGHIVGDWDQRLIWLNDILAEAWRGRGPFPGAGSVLQYLGCLKGTSFQRTVLEPMTKRGENSWDYVLSILEGRIEPSESAYREGLLKARERWGIITSRHALLSKLARLELTPGQVQRIATMFSRKLSVLTGGAGTGKTSVLKVFLEESAHAEGRHPVLLLAPTGKARVRLSTKTEHDTMTIHQFLLKQGWFVPDVFVLKQQSERNPFQAATVIIDECSMIPADVFGTLLHALDFGPLRRLILVGDPDQLPPIGPGRPFADIIGWLQKDHAACIAPLTISMRVDEKEGVAAEASVALALADGYRASAVSPGDDEILASVAKGQGRGDLDVVFWDDHDDLLAKLKGRMASLLGIEDHNYESFNHSLGIDSEEWTQSEAWQILSPTRAQHFGTDDLNRLIQREFKSGLLQKKPKPFGDYEIVWTDKVIQVHNRSKKGWAYPKNRGLDYVANGEIGIVSSTSPIKGGSDTLDVVFSTQNEVSYRYYRNDVDRYLELAYALTVHKAQGSDFDVVFLIIPQNASTLSRELIYTGLTRFRHKLVLFIENDITSLLRLRSPDCSDTRMRNTHMFTLALRPDDVKRPHVEALIHRTRQGVAVRSKSEVVVADVLEALGISYKYEIPLYSRTNQNDFRLPDFTVSFDGDIFYWEHLGMLNNPGYRESWERKRKWYEENGFADQLITSEDGSAGSIDATVIEKTARRRILGEPC